jgi:hypothetical protein
MKSILSDVVSKYSRHTENICSESLALIINQSPQLQKAWNDLIKNKSQGKIELSADFKFLTQVTSKKDTAIPDLEIKAHSDRMYLVEAKFWAGLTDQQPNTYIKRIQEKESGALIFLAPERRIPSLKIEAKKRLVEEFIVQEWDDGIGFQIEDSVSVLFLSWMEALTALWDFATVSGDFDSLHNLFQLKTLVQKLDSEGFIPFDPLLFSPAAAKQRDQLVDLLDALIKNTPELVKDKLSYGGGKYAVQDYFRINGKLEGFLMYSSDYWLKFHISPIYFCLSLKHWGSGEPVFLIKEIEIELLKNHIQYFMEDDLNPSYKCLAIPLIPLIGASKEDTFTDLKRQLNESLIHILPFAQ